MYITQEIFFKIVYLSMAFLLTTKWKVNNLWYSLQAFYFSNSFKQRLCIFSKKLSNENKQRLYKIQKSPTSLFYHVLLIKLRNFVIEGVVCQQLEEIASHSSITNFLIGKSQKNFFLYSIPQKTKKRTFFFLHFYSIILKVVEYKFFDLSWVGPK